MDQDLVLQFTSITGSSPSLAEQYLRLGDNNLEQAIGLFFANEGAELGTGNADSQPASAPPSTTRKARTNTGYADEDGVVHLDSDDEGNTDTVNGKAAAGYDDNIKDEVPVNNPQTSATPGLPKTAQNANFEDDEAMARRLQEELYGGSGAGNAPSTGIGDQGYRAPIARTTQTLVGPDSFDPSNPEEMRAAVMEQMVARRQPRSRDRPGIFNQDASNFGWSDASPEPSHHRDQLSRATGGASESSSKANVLAEMYRPPFELMSGLSWDEARDEGKQNEKWILVNIQDASIFDCQLLNRDVWKNSGVMETVKENFVFMQYSKDNPRGNQYVQYYFPNKDADSAYPHIAIVDPRTGEQVKVWSGPPAPKALDFLMQLHEFLDRYSLKASAKNPVARRKAEPSKETRLDRMTEEQQLEMAMQASLAGGGQGLRESDPDALTRSIGNIGEVGGTGNMTNETDDEHAETNGVLRATKSEFDDISSHQTHVEPAPDPSTTTRIQFRHPTGRVVRRFTLTDSVRRIYEWLKASPLEGKEGIGFELVFMQKNLLTLLDATIEEAGLRNGTVMVEFSEEN